MAVFRYEALNKRGENLKGSIEALNSKDAISKLRDKSLFPTKVRLLSGREIASPEKPKPVFRDYTFVEWAALSNKDMVTIANHYWSMFPPEPGKLTRNAIVSAFLDEYPLFKSAASVGFRWFGWYEWCVYVVVKDSATRVPSEFCGFTVNKGVLKKQTSPEEWIVDWRDVGGKNSIFKPKFIDETNDSK